MNMTDKQSILDRPILSKELQVKKLEKRLQRTENHARLLSRLVSLEDEVYKIEDERELVTHLCNATRDLLPFNQSFFGKVDSRRKTFRLKAGSSVPGIDRDSPFTHWFESVIERFVTENEGKKPLTFRLENYSDDTSFCEEQYPNVECLWSPQVYNDQLVGGFLALRESPWTEQEEALAARLSTMYMHASGAIKGRSTLIDKRSFKKPVIFGVLALLIFLCFISVPITTLAPVEVTPKDPFIVTAPFDGVVKTVVPEQGEALMAGDESVVFDDVRLRNEMRLAAQRMQVAKTKYDRTSQGAIDDFSIKRDIEVAKAQYELAKAESEYATQLYNKSSLKSPVDGIAIYSEKKDWEGKPVSAGEAILSIANPGNVEFSIDLPVKDSLVLEKGARIRVFLDSDPLNPLDAVLIEANYSATADKLDVLSYQLKARLVDNNGVLPRIGVQGTAQVFGEKATLGYVLLRRPYSALRQMTGW